jgi:predicted MPP superfamily phosphohydrolase
MEITSSKIPESFDGYKILQISDFHSRMFRDGNAGLINEIDKASPDIIVLTGDMVTGNETDFTTFFALIKELAPKYKIYFVPGNHEVVLSLESKQEFLKCFEENNVTFLDNNSVQLEKDGETVNLYGLWYEKKYYTSQELTSEEILNRMGESDKGKYNILLAHQPKYFPLYQEWGADLILSGHLHGGMVRLPFIGAVFSPDGELFPKYSAGQYTLQDSVLVVSRGVGIGSRGFRVLNRPELVLITLKTA